MIEKDYEYCKKIIDKHSKTFSLAFASLPEQKRNGVYALYAFNRQMDDYIDDDNDLTLLTNHFNKLKAVFANELVDEPIFRALKDTIQHFNITIDPFIEMYEGQKQDYEFKNIETFNELIDYSMKVAGSVGSMLAPILATKHNREVEQSARQLGVAMQLTNILRDIYQDYQNGRVYLPQSLLKPFSVNLDEVIQNKINEHYINLFEFIALHASLKYEESLEQIHLYDEDSQKIVIAAAKMYGAIIPAIRNQKYDLKKRAHLSKTEKLRILRLIYHESK